jgi:hypothetical protein
MDKETSTHIHYADLQLVSSSPIIDKYRVKRWYNESGEKHREDGPALECANGTKEWYQNGELHRVNGPAVERANGDKEWWLNNQLHCGNGPAIEWVNGAKEWWVNGELHRVNGPAIERANGDKEWYQNGELHRVNGPAIEFPNEYKKWYKNGKLHREDGPAREYANGAKEWWVNGQLHREDGPAVEWADGAKEWYFNGEFCRNEVAIVEWSDKRKRWCFPNHIELSYAEIELEFLPEIFEDAQTLYSQYGGAVQDQDGWLHLEGLFRGQELEPLLALIVPCIKTPVRLIISKPDAQGEQTLLLDKNGIYDQAGQKIILALDNALEKIHRLLNLSV